MPVTAVDGAVLDQLSDSLGGDVELIRRVIDRYLEGMDDRVQALREACDHEPTALERAAHALASPSATLGVRCIAEPCMALEKVAEEGKPPQHVVRQLVTSIENAVEPARQALRNWLERK